ncbi:MotE family protein [Brevibacillus sp. NPDC058079]|uniref:MotE family protein n=1 Tax=Brevibacillus sp. NPDC058079 TaxID=3346330 RepID=UPI0036E5C2F8
MEEIQEEREYGRWEWFFYMIVIPALFASLLGGVLLSLLGVNVLGTVLHWANSIPYVEKLVPDEYAATRNSEEQPDMDKQVATLQQDHAKNQQQISTLKEESAKKDATIVALEKQLDDVNKAMEDKRATEEERQKQFAGLAKVYTTMSPKNAAAIIENLKLQESVAVMTKMKPAQQADILAKMEPEKAADISILLKDSVVNKDDDIAALQQRVNVLTKALSESRDGSESAEDLKKTFAQLPPADAAAIIRSLMVTNSGQAIALMKDLPVDKRAQTLSAIANDDKKQKEPDNLAARVTEELLRK